MGVLIDVIGFDIGLVLTARGVLYPCDRREFQIADSLGVCNAGGALETHQIAGAFDVIWELHIVVG